MLLPGRASLFLLPLLAAVEGNAQSGTATPPPPGSGTFGQSLWDRYGNWGEEHMLRNAQSMHPPVLTPYGWQEHSSVAATRQFLDAARKPSMADELIEQQKKNTAAPRFEDPNKVNASRNPSAASRTKDKHDELRELAEYLNHVAPINHRMARTGYYDSQVYEDDLRRYQDAFEGMKDMLEGRAELSIADAFYMAEAAYGNLHLSHEEYKAEIARGAGFIRQWMRENGLDERNPEAVHLAIQKFMGDDLTVRNTDRIDQSGNAGLPVTHAPYKYDYIDCRAEEDLCNHFLTKTLATGTGQCLTLPHAYLVYAEALGVEAHLTFLPQHSFIKYRNNKGTFQNYEPTVHWHMSDNEYLEMMPVMSSALANGIYLHPLSREQTIASVMIDLARYHYREHWVADGAFMEQCLGYAMRYFHNGEGHAVGMAMKGQVLTAQLDMLLQKHGITDLARIPEVPEAERIYRAYRSNVRRIDELGIQQYPEEVYNAMLEKHDTRGRLQQARGTDTKAARSLFSNQQRP